MGGGGGGNGWEGRGKRNLLLHANQVLYRYLNLEQGLHDKS